MKIDITDQERKVLIKALRDFEDNLPIISKDKSVFDNMKTSKDLRDRIQSLY